MAEITEQDLCHASNAIAQKMVLYRRIDFIELARAALQSYVDAHPELVEVRDKTGVTIDELYCLEAGEDEGFRRGFEAGAKAMKSAAVKKCKDNRNEGIGWRGVKIGLDAAVDLIEGLPLPTPGDKE